MPSRRKDQERMMISFPVFFLSCFRKKRGKDFLSFFLWRRGKMRSRDFLFLFSFLFSAEEKKKTFVPAMERGRRVLSFYFHKESRLEMAYGADSFSLFLRSPFA